MFTLTFVVNKSTGIILIKNINCHKRILLQQLLEREEMNDFR